MSDAELLVQEIRAYCAAHADAKGAVKYKRYFREGFDAWGILDKDAPLWTEKRAEWLGRYRGLGWRGFLQAGALLFASGKYEEGSLAIQFAKEFRGQFGADAIKRLAKWFEAGLANWAHTDVLCGEILSPLLTGGQIEFQALAPWRNSPLKYQRRAVPVAMLGLVKTADVAPLLDFIRPLMMDGERVVQQGLGWFLREAWKRDRRPVEAFLLAWKDLAPRLIFQYATEKMPAEERQRFRRAKTAANVC